MEQDDLYYWFALKSIPLVGNITYRRLIEAFVSPAKVLSAPIEEICKVDGVGKAAALSITTYDYNPYAEKELDAFYKSGADIITIKDADYPSLLLEIPDPPPFLYLKGSIPKTKRSIAIVGSRKATDYGIATTAKLARELAERGITVVSGMARGVDAAAHRAALNGIGSSIGVIGSGIDIEYPIENRSLYREMEKTGAIISEFPIGAKPDAANFPRRNRIISGISHGVLVVEATEKSGSLITAGLALEQNREVFAIPGNINSRGSKGSNNLIKQGAKLVEDVFDILSELSPGEFQIKSSVTGNNNSMSPNEKLLYSLVSD
ncbi:MAG: DNA-processing protein DprA, partial [Desulfuromonadales bacterium]|nr:DNA-processing protein DprA [Desulfuromonadales bacterium]